MCALALFACALALFCMPHNGFVYDALRVSVTNLLKKTKAIIQREDFPMRKIRSNELYTLLANVLFLRNYITQSVKIYDSNYYNSDIVHFKFCSF